MFLSTPVVFLIFNRPEHTYHVFQAIRQAKPEKLLIVADGPRSSEESEKCVKTRAILDEIDWDCQVMTNFSEINLGCKRRVSSGLDWAFSEVEEAIILEDDCLPAPCFFSYCQLLLDRYRHDERVMMISGTNLQEGQSRTLYSYYFSKYSHIWGWATWRRAWQHYDVEMQTWQEYKDLNLIGSICEDPLEQNYWTWSFDEVYSGRLNTWDYQWLYTCWNQNGLSILPNHNLISNIGFGPEATHTIGDSRWANLPTFDLGEIKHPPFVVRNKNADDYTFEYHYGGKSLREQQNPPLNRRIKDFARKSFRRITSS